MRTLTIILTLMLSGCAGWQGWTPLQTVKGADGSEWTWIRPMPASANGQTGAWGTSAQVTTYQGTVNRQGYTVQSFGRGR